MSDTSKVIDLEGFRSSKQAAPADKESVAASESGTWERTSLPLFPAQGGSASNVEPVRIVKVSSGFGKLRAPAWEDSMCCMAA